MTRSVLSLVAVLLLAIAGPAHAQRGTLTRDGVAVLDAFKPVVAKPSESTVRIAIDGADVALGTIVSADGFIITKASLLKGKIVCFTKDGDRYPARVVGTEEEHDLAMLKVQATGLKAIEWRSSLTAEVGNWVASPGLSERPVAIGVVSVATRKIPNIEMGKSGFLGVILNRDKDNAVIDVVSAGSAAEKAGLKQGDVVLAVAGKKILTADKLISTIQGFKPGETVALMIKRGKDEKEMKVTLGKRPILDRNDRGDRMNAMGSKLSDRRIGFPVLLQTDQVVKPHECGGPLVDLDGKAVGINIARGGRTESYAIPSEAVQALLSDLKSGKLAPKEEGIARLVELDKELATAEDALKVAEKAAKDAEDDPKATDAKKRELATKVDTLKQKIADTQEAINKIRKDRTKK